MLCPDCRSSLSALRCGRCGRCVDEQDGVPLLFPGGDRFLPDGDTPASEAQRQRQRALYSHVATEYDEAIPGHVARHYLERRLALFARWLIPGGLVLDVGCGTGVLAAAMAARGFRVVGVDGSPEMLRLARRRGVASYAAPSTLLPFPDGIFDGAVTVATLHHVAEPAAVATTIGEMVRVLRPGGRAVIWDHNPNNPYWPIIMRRVPQDDGSERLVPLREILAAAGRSGARTALATRYGFMPDFLPRGLLPLARGVERALEALPPTRWLAAHNVVVLERPLA